MGYAPMLALSTLFERDRRRSAATSTSSSATRRSPPRPSRSSATPGSTPSESNPYGGAIALGHPVGATGAILALRVAKHLVRHDLEQGVVTMCIGGGQALAALFRRV